MSEVQIKFKFPITVLVKLDFSEFTKEELKEMRNETFSFFNDLIDKKDKEAGNNPQ